MEKFTERKFVKAILVYAILLTMLLSYLPPISFAVEARAGSNDDYVTINVTDMPNNVRSDTNINFGITTSFTGIQTGFKNVSLYVTSNDEIDEVTGEQTTPSILIAGTADSGIPTKTFTQLEYGNIATGSQKFDSFVIKFPSEGRTSKYTKSFNINVTGEYKNPQTGLTETFNEKKVITATVFPKDEEYTFDPQIDFSVSSGILRDSPEWISFTKGTQKGKYKDKVLLSGLVNLYDCKYINELELQIVIPYLKFGVCNGSYLIADFSSFTDDGFEIKSVTGLNSTTDIPGETINEKQNGYFVENDIEGKAVFTLVKKAASNNLNDSFSINNNKGKGYNFKMKCDTGFTDDVVNANNIVKTININQDISCTMKAKGFNYSAIYNEASDNVIYNNQFIDNKEFTKTEKFEQSVYVFPIGYHNHGMSISNREYRSTGYNDHGWENFKNNPAEKFRVRVDVDNSYASNDVVGYIEIKDFILNYKSESGENKSVVVNNGAIKLESIESNLNITIINEEGDTVGTLNELNEKWEPTEENNSCIYTLQIENWGNTHKVVDFNYNYSYAKLIELGLTDKEIRNGVTFIQPLQTYASNYISWPNTTAVYSIRNVQPKVSYFELDIGNIDSKYSEMNRKQTKTIQLKMNNDKIKRTDPGEFDYVAYNVNPTFYVKLASDINNPDFEYLNLNASIASYAKDGSMIAEDNEVAKQKNSNLKITNTYYKTIDNELYYVIETDGKYSSSENNDLAVNVQFTRRLINGDADSIQNMEVYMLTDNQDYYNGVLNSVGFEKNTNIPETVFLATQQYKIIEDALTSAETRVINISNRPNKTYVSNLTNGENETPEKNSPMVLIGGDTAKFVGRIENKFNFNMKNVQLMYRLPVKNNVSTKKDSETNTYKPILENDFVLPDEYIDENSNLVNIEKGQAVPKVSLVDLSNINVTINKQPLETTEYTIYYSNTIGAEYDLTAYNAYVEGADLSNATTILVVLNRDLLENEKVELNYTMKMPESNTLYGMTGAMFGAKYDYVDEHDDTSTTILDSEAVYIVKGERAKLEIQKTYEGYEKTEKPSWLASLAGVQFKLKKSDGTYLKDIYDNDNDGDTDEDLIIVTDNTGLATANELDSGIYQIEEVSAIPGFDGLKQTYLVDVQDGKDVKIEVENKIKYVTLNIHKTWENTNEILGKVRLKVIRTSDDNVIFKGQKVEHDEQGWEILTETYSNTTVVETDEQGNATVVVPYGEYTVREDKGTYGWYSEPVIGIQAINEEQNVEVINKIATGTIIINKTVPETQSVKELTFNVTSTSATTYKNLSDENVNLNINIDIPVNTTNPIVNNISNNLYDFATNVTVDVSDDERVATITLSNLPLALYTISEVAIPTISATNPEPKYVGVTRMVALNEQGQEKTERIVNRKKVGYLQINKTAYIPTASGNQEIGDLSQFRIQITGNSDYGTSVNQIISLDENGNAKKALEIGTYRVTEVPVDGYEVYYKNSDGNLIYSTTGVDVQITYNTLSNKGNTTVQDIQNVLTGVGYVRVEKTLEDITDPEEVKNANIIFRVKGKNAAGVRVEYPIHINNIDTDKNVAYGISEAIPVGGEYELEEMESSIPQYYDGMASRKITITTAEEDAEGNPIPMIVNVDNKRAIGDLQILTSTEPEGGELRGITYKVTEIKTNSDGSITKLDGTNGTENTIVEIAGSNGDTDTSYAEIKEIKAGKYLVELVNIPAGYIIDKPQIAEVPAYGIGYANFIIEKIDNTEYTKLIVTKEILNSNNEIADEEDFEKAHLNADEIFEVKVTNVNTKEKFYTYISTSSSGIISNLPEGVYEIEEIYKPKYELQGYYNAVNGIITEQLTQTAEGKYTFEVIAGNSSLINTVEIAIKNKINTKFPYGGQDSKDNLSKVDVETIKQLTKTIVYVVDEDGNELPGVEFQLYKISDEGEQLVNIGTNNNVFTTRSKKIAIKGLEPGAYKLVNTSVPSGYKTAKDKMLVVYEEFSSTSRIEIQRDIARGTVTLATTYVNSYGDTANVPRSKYKVVDTQTGQLVKFTKTTTGDYVKSNLADATDIITLKSGSVEIEGLETGKYEIGLVDVTNGFAMTSDYPETVELSANDVKEVSVNVTRAGIVEAHMGYYNTMYLDESGQLWIIGANNYGEYANGKTEYTYNDIPNKINFPEENIYITSFAIGYNTVVAIDSKGRVWSWGNGYIGNGINGPQTTPICLSEIDNTDLNKAYKNGITIKQVQVNYYNGYLLDSDGKIWSWGKNDKGAVGNGKNEDVMYPICISDIEDTELYDAYNNGIQIKNLGDTTGYCTYTGSAIDTLGRVWTWGNNGTYQIGNGRNNNINSPMCISEIEGEFAEANIVYLAMGEYRAIAIDKDGYAWAWGSGGSYSIPMEVPSTTSKPTPIKIPSSLFGGVRIIKAFCGYDKTIFIDEYGKVWACGSFYGYGTLMNPVCISNNSDIENIKIKDVHIFNRDTILLAENGTCWGLGGNSNRGQLGYIGSNTLSEPTKIQIDYTKHLEYNLKFEKVICEYRGAIALDENGDIWCCGEENYTGMGTTSNKIQEFRINRDLEGKNIVDIDGCGFDIYIVLSKSGEVYVFGYNNTGISAGLSSSSYIYKPLNITEKFDLDPNAIIVDVALANNTAIALDSTGKVWTWGSGNNYFLGNGSTSSINTPTCISDEISEPLYGVNIKSVSGCGAGCFAIDDLGRIWYWGKYGYCGIQNSTGMTYYNGSYITKPTCITDNSLNLIGYEYENGTRFVQISAANEEPGCAAALDNKGRIWILYYNLGNYSNQNKDAICLNTESGGVIYNESLKYENYKIEKIYAEFNNIYFTDNKGTTWNLLGAVTKLTNKYNVPNDIRYISYCASSYQFLIDGYGQLWSYSSSGSAKCLSGEIMNPLYNVNVSTILEDGIVETENGEIYVVDSTSVNFLMYSEKYINKNIIQTDRYITRTFDQNYIIALDEDGKLWTCGGTNIGSANGGVALLGNNTNKASTQPICISDIDGTELNNAYKNDPNFKIEKFEVFKYGFGNSSNAYSYVYAYDNYGKIWTWGSNKYKQLCNGTDNTLIYTPTCISNISGTDLFNAYQEYSDFKFEQTKMNNSNYTASVFALDNHGNMWVGGNNALAQSSSTLVRLNKRTGTDLYNNTNEELEEKLYEEIVVNEKQICLIDGKIWRIDGDNIVCLNNVEGSELAAKNSPGFGIVNMYRPNNYYNRYYAIDTDGKIWSWGDNKYSLSLYCADEQQGAKTYDAYLLGDGTSDNKTVTQPICISDIAGTDLNNAYVDGFKIEELRMLNDFTMTATDNTGNVWLWGLNKIGESGNGSSAPITSPYCISTPIKNADATVVKYDMFFSQEYVTSGVYDNKFVIVMLDSNGDIWTCGGSTGNIRVQVSWSNLSPGIIGENNYNNKTTLTKVNGVSNISDFIISSNGSIWAIGNGKVYAWGYNKNGVLGTGEETSGTNGFGYIKENDTVASSVQRNYYDTYTPQELLGSSSIHKIIAVVEDQQYVLAVDTYGKLWAWGYGNYIPGLSDNTFHTPTCLADLEGSIFKNKVIVSARKETNDVYLTDADNVKYLISNGREIILTQTVLQPTSYRGILANKTIVSSSANMAVDSDGKLYGWNSCDGNSNEIGTFDYPVCITDKKITKESNFRNNKTLVNVPVANEMYGTKFEDIINDQMVLDKNGDYWFFPETGNVINLSQKIAGEANPIYGKTILRCIEPNYVETSDNEIYAISIPYSTSQCKYVMKKLPDSEIQDIKYYLEKLGKEYYVALDKNGKIWTCGNGTYGQLGNHSIENTTEPVCISDIEGTDLHEQYVNDPNFRITAIVENGVNNSTGSLGIIALDSNGKLWSWGYNMYGELGNNTTKYSTTPICISNISGTALNSEYADPSYKIEEVKIFGTTVYARDSKNKLWVWGYNGSSQLGDGTTLNSVTPKCITDIPGISSLDKLAYAKFNSNVAVIVIDINGKVWTWGANNRGQLGNNGTNTSNVPFCISTQDGNNLKTAHDEDSNFRIEKMFNYNENGSTDNIYVIDNNGKIWSWGFNNLGEVGIGVKGSTVTNPVCISNIEGTELYNTNVKIQKIYHGDSVTFAIDEIGKVWTWGSNSSGTLGYEGTASYSPKCISNIADTELCNAYVADFKIIQVALVGSTAFMLDNQGKIWSCGSGSYYILGNGQTTSISSFICISDITDTELGSAYVIELLNVRDTIRARCSNGDIYYWGSQKINSTSVTLPKPTKYGMYNSGITNIKNLGKQIAEIIDETHIKTTEGTIYMVNNTGNLTQISSYTPAPREDYSPVSISGINIVDNSTYKALDDEGNLYVWNKYLGGIKAEDSTVQSAINASELEYIVEPLYQETNGWSLIKRMY